MARIRREVIRHIRGDGLDTKLGSLPKPVKERLKRKSHGRIRHPSVAYPL